MRKDQIERLNDLAEQIGEVFLEEADPATWSGAGLPLADMDKDTRGGRYWDKKNAIQTGTLLARVLDLAERDSRSLDTKMDEDDAEGEIDKYEKKAKDLLRDIQSRSKST
jgi:hypothetical protein